MEEERAPPKRLYKYRAFSALTVDSLVGDKLYFADPTTFNDPLDTRPSIDVDLSVPELEAVVRTLVETRTAAEMRAAAQTIKYRGPKTMDHIERHSRRHAERLIADIAYNATNPDYLAAPAAAQLSLLGNALEHELLRQYDRGVFSLAERNDCPLMWSHYGDQHHGLCIGYSVPEVGGQNLHKVRYGGSRLVAASKVAAMLVEDKQARDDVDAAVLARKAYDWRYEREWRLVGQRGLVDSPLELEDITFGTRCMSSVKHAVVKALEGCERAVKLYEMREVHGTFKLKRAPLDEDELGVSYPRRALSALEGFDSLPDS